MRRHAWLPFVVALAALALASCGNGGLGGGGLDGGVGGTGISLISGNVAPETDMGADDVAGIRVTVLGTEIQTETDQEGFFALEGAFEGNITLEFEERDGTENMLPLDVPTGGIVSLRDVRLAAGRASVDSIEVDFEGIVAADAECDVGSQQVEVSDRGLSNQFLVRLDGATFEFDARRCPDLAEESREAACTDLLSRRTIRVVGLLGDGGAIDARSVRLVNCRAPGTGR